MGQHKNEWVSEKSETRYKHTFISKTLFITAILQMAELSKHPIKFDS